MNNGARPSGAVIFKPKDDQGYTVNLTEAQRQQVLTDLNNRFSGSQKPNYDLSISRLPESGTSTTVDTRTRTYVRTGTYVRTYRYSVP